MKAFQPYVDHLRCLAAAVDAEQTSVESEDIRHALDGGAPDALRRLVGLNLRRASGAFFTGSDLAQAAWRPLLNSLNSESVIADPACGAGSLLLPGLHALLQLTNCQRACTQIRGLDISETFVEAARTRLLLSATAAVTYAPTATARPGDFYGIRVGDALEQFEDFLKGITHIVLNPPYNITDAPPGCGWATGKVNNAAIFLEGCLRNMPPGSHVSAILPDVLKSGTRYKRWREQINKIAIVQEVIPWGIFDNQTDVHVFIAHLIRRREIPEADKHTREANIFNREENTCSGETVSRYFEITVGTVVPHRHPETGPLRPFATARLLPAWGAVAEIDSKRRYSGRCETPPFVVIRRTSRPGQNPRTSATLITGNGEVAVDNHLLVARPRDQREERCRQLLTVLQDESSTRWLDYRYQCRHLPVEAIAGLPWFDEERMS